MIFISAVVLSLDGVQEETPEEAPSRWDEAKYPIDGRCFLIADPEMTLFKVLTMKQMAEFIAKEELEFSFSNVLKL